MIRKISGKNLLALAALLLTILMINCLGIDLSIGDYGGLSVICSSSNSTGNTDQLTNKTFIIDEWRREINLDAWNGISGFDYYSIRNVYPTEIHKISLFLPAKADEIHVQDAYGEYSPLSIFEIRREDTVQINLTLKRPLKPEEKNEFLVSYKLPLDTYIEQTGWQDYRLKLKLIKPKNVIIKKFSLIIHLPEGAEPKNFPLDLQVKRQGLATMMILTMYNVTEFSTSHIMLEYQYSILWRAFKPLTWIGATVLIFVAFFLIKRFFYPAAVTVPVPSTLLGDFVKVYEEKRRLTMELWSVEEQFRSGRISRKRLRMRRRTIERRISELNKRLSELKDKITATSDRYGELIKELEAAEVEIETLNADIERVEARFRRGEISADVRRRLIDEYASIRRKTEGRISEILLRLQEEASS
ncbi:hypothetical protein J7L18_05195 [Candidatus Bathyarchaeota archaeon]|nr:hypothetical protein [Candidatus Bathyarchaeota archaeon]